jgi:hypothetical protein
MHCSEQKSSPLSVAVTLNQIVLWALVFLLIFGYELFNFSLSIDEEFHTFNTGWQMANDWLQQGRWGMALLLLALPPISALPVVSTMLFGAGLVAAVVHLVSYYRIQGLHAHILALSVLVSPVWPHIVQFNSISWGIGIGVALCAMGLRLLADDRRKTQILGAVALTLAFGIYQTLVLAAVVMALGRYLLCDRQGHNGRVWLETGRTLGFIVASALVSLTVQYVAMRVAGVGIAYVDSFWRVSKYLADPVSAFFTSLWASATRIFGLHPIYLGYGLAFVVLPFLGILFAFVRKDRKERDSRVLSALSLSGIIAAVSLPVFVAVGAVPSRSLVALPFMSGVLAACVPLHTRLTQQAATAYLVVLVFLGVWVSTTLFYSDHVMRERDRVLGASLMARLEEFRTPGEPLTFTLVGKLEPVPGVPVRRVEVFGASFFDWDQGNVFRVHSFLRILGAHYLTPVDIAHLPDVALKAEAMPTWPARGSVAMVDGVAVIKLSQLTYEQRYRLEAINRGHPSGLTLSR